MNAATLRDLGREVVDGRGIHVPQVVEVIDKFLFYRYICACGWADTTNYARNEDALDQWRRHARG